jgi:NAD(P)-dependent dehydrogenase (short-subunit alcohol dehydrogenase family)
MTIEGGVLVTGANRGIGQARVESLDVLINNAGLGLYEDSNGRAKFGGSTPPRTRGEWKE